MLRNECGRSRWPVGAAVGKLAVMLVVLTAASLAPGAPKKDKDEDQQFTQIYSHTYDEVFQASQETIERMGMFVTDKDKDKGRISGNGKCELKGEPERHRYTFDIHIEALNTKPETRVTINCQLKERGFTHKAYEKLFKEEFSSELQKVLATYK
ncbi:MAG: hypothetical protein ABSF14_11940 [Terriglobia bacterium]